MGELHRVLLTCCLRLGGNWSRTSFFSRRTITVLTSSLLSSSWLMQPAQGSASAADDDVLT